MAKKLSRSQVQSVLSEAKHVIDHEFIIEVAKKKSGKHAAMLKGRNGEPIMPQETVNEKASAEYIAARLIAGGLRAKYKDLTGDKPSRPTPKRYVTNG